MKNNLKLFLIMFKIGLFTFGGCYAMIPLVQETVWKHNWLSENQFSNFIGVCETTPGPIAINMATYVGSVQANLLGSLCATIGVVLPSFIIIVLIAMVLKKFIKNKYFQNFLDGIKPVILALILSTGLILVVQAIGYSSLKQFNFNWESLLILSLITIIFISYKLIYKKKLNTIMLIMISAILGIIVSIISKGF